METLTAALKSSFESGFPAEESSITGTCAVPVEGNQLSEASSDER